ncbi:hypothetical protein PHYSODRAFT_329991 [Phytophthora sojae]|uniref:Reverse transcriptase domain-containing protein n=1 Tax=Phytophthora sojae (strain P6497) TaxID=1094619 RepID=G4ZCA7_PHYSP|nr:hypothetical protein PHYSODRAFT_329991 [Phytophthora sojae]EGZ22135.1 hypothetical protein PHYSODRAFT_329991 [Phytophthora sojae]|eukprot:XP_009524852.1 hypothetical protein PHYSODRAFT_329991 [Phytophthora sojae]
MRTQAPLILARPEDFLPTSSWKPDQHVYVRVLRTRPDHAVATPRATAKRCAGLFAALTSMVKTYQGKSVNNSAIKTADTTRAALRDFNVTVLDRVLGTYGSDGSRDVAAILNGHAVDYAYYVDGNRPLSLKMPMRKIPGINFQHVDPYLAPTIEPELELDLDLALELDLDLALELVTRHSSSIPSLLPLRIQRSLRYSQSSRETMQSWMTLSKTFSNAPRPRHQYLDRNKRPAESADINSRPTQRRAPGVEPAMPSAIDALERSQAGTNFRPTSLQQAVRGLIVHPDYAGITPHPAILMKLFDFAFGIRGLSLAHLERCDLTAQRKWRRQGANMNNFAASVDLPRSRCLTTMAELFEAFLLLQAFALKFYNAATQEFITAAMSFAATITGMGLWNASAVDLITFWFDGVLDEYRRAVEDLAVSGVDNRGRVRQRFAKNDPDFINTIHLVHTEANATTLKEAPYFREGIAIAKSSLTLFDMAFVTVFVNVSMISSLRFQKITSLLAMRSMHFGGAFVTARMLGPGLDPQFEARLIHDLSHPKGRSTNAASDRSQLPTILYVHVRAIARRIEYLRKRYPNRRIMMVKGDVKSAFRQIMLAAEIVRWFCGKIPEDNAAVIDTALPFGWTGSPGHYGVFEGAISHRLGLESPGSLDPRSSDKETFFAYEWVDDHICVEPDIDNRLELSEAALRLAMMAFLGPRSINDSKFSRWEQQLTTLGLEWST